MRYATIAIVLALFSTTDLATADDDKPTTAVDCVWGNGLIDCLLPGGPGSHDFRSNPGQACEEFVLGDLAYVCVAAIGKMSLSPFCSGFLSWLTCPHEPMCDGEWQENQVCIIVTGSSKGWGNHPGKLNVYYSHMNANQCSWDTASGGCGGPHSDGGRYFHTHWHEMNGEWQCHVFSGHAEVTPVAGPLAAELPTGETESDAPGVCWRYFGA